MENSNEQADTKKRGTLTSENGENWKVEEVEIVNEMDASVEEMVDKLIEDTWENQVIGVLNDFKSNNCIDQLKVLPEMSEEDLFKEFDKIFANILGTLPPKRD